MVPDALVGPMPRRTSLMSTSSRAQISATSLTKLIRVAR